MRLRAIELKIAKLKVTETKGSDASTVEKAEADAAMRTSELTSATSESARLSVELKDAQAKETVEEGSLH